MLNACVDEHLKMDNELFVNKALICLEEKCILPWQARQLRNILINITNFGEEHNRDNNLRRCKINDSKRHSYYLMILYGGVMLFSWD